MTELLSNGTLTISVNRRGAELCSILRTDNNREYVWQANPLYWKRHSPVLFPIVGSLWNNTMRYKDKSYVMTQHGFARDMDFELIAHESDELRYRLAFSERTLDLYPFMFELQISYTLRLNQIIVGWQIKNLSTDDMYFQIGAHPAFNYADYNPDAEIQGFFRFDKNGSFHLSVIGEKGCLSDACQVMPVPEGITPITRHTFDHDALIFENAGINAVELLDRNQRPYVRLDFSAPVVGLWSPAKDGYAPFACIEPWFGRCDRMNFTGEFNEKDWIQCLHGKKEFCTSYTITII